MRGTGFGGGHDEREQTLNQILAEMDGFEGHEAVIVLAATNRPDVLDPALLRPGRFDRHVTLDLPDRRARRDPATVHCRKVPLAADVDLDKLAAGTPGFSGADLKNLVNEAAMVAAREGRATSPCATSTRCATAPAGHACAPWRSSRRNATALPCTSPATPRPPISCRQRSAATR